VERDRDGSAPQASGELAGLLTTKLHVPPRRSEIVPRPRLLERLDAHPTGRLTLLCAPAGYGKTTVAAEWIGRAPAVGWVSLDDGDNDPTRFWRYVGAALRRARPDLPVELSMPSGGGGHVAASTVATTVANALDTDDEVVLVLDDYHVIDAADVHASVVVFLEHVPPSVHVVISSRADPPLPLARLRANGHLTELRARDLRFTGDEAADLLAAAVDHDLPPQAIAVLADRTEGWAAGLHLAALSLQQRRDVAGFVDTFSGSNRFVLDYLAEEVLNTQPEQLRTFLLETSVAERLSGPLCDAMTGRADSQDLLETIEQANLFLVPLDDERRWWRYHHLFADLLQARLARERPDRPRVLHAAAADWFESNGDIHDAIRHALRGDDAPRAATLLTRHFDVLLHRNEDATVTRWLDNLPTDIVASRASLQLARGFLAVHRGDIDAIETAATAAEQTTATDGDVATGMLADTDAAVTVLRAGRAYLRGDAAATVELARDALETLRDGHWMLRSFAQWRLAIGAWLTGDLAEAEDAFVAWMHDWRIRGDPNVAVWCHFYRGQVQHARGQLNEARRTYEQALAVSGAGPTSGPALVGLAEVAYQRGDLATAEARLAEGLRHCRQLGHGPPQVAALALQARLCHAAGDTRGAMDALREADAVGVSHGAVSLLNPAATTRAWITLSSGDPAEVARLAAQHPRPAEITYATEPDCLIEARTLLTCDQAAAALTLLERLDGLAVAQQRMTSVIEIRVLRARAHDALGDRPRTLDTLRSALALAAPEGFVQVFVDEGPPIATLLAAMTTTTSAARELAEAGLPLSHVERVLGGFDDAGLEVGGRPARTTIDALITPLTDRETEVLALLAAGRPNRAIASELFISLDTVKRHVTHIFDKLGTHNRTEAAATARALGLLHGE
jgi:LuxR family maltose regulon positive regulatory protein